MIHTSSTEDLNSYLECLLECSGETESSSANKMCFSRGYAFSSPGHNREYALISEIISRSKKSCVGSISLPI